MTAENPGSRAMPVVPADRVVITVGDVKLTAAQFDQIIENIPEQFRASARGPGRKVFADNVVKILVLYQEGKRRKLDEGPAFQTQAMFQNANLLAGLTFTQMGKDVPVDEAAVRKAYEDRKAEWEQIHARHILIRMQGSSVPVKPGQKELSEAEALARATELRKKIEAGADFATLATTESDDSPTAAKGGDLGTVRKGQMVPSMDQAAFAMKPGELSEPVKSQLGYHLIKVESHDVRTLEQVRPELEKQMRPDLAQKALTDLEKKATVALDPEFFGTAKQ